MTRNEKRGRMKEMEKMKRIPERKDGGKRSGEGEEWTEREREIGRELQMDDQQGKGVVRWTVHMLL